MIPLIPELTQGHLPCSSSSPGACCCSYKLHLDSHAGFSRVLTAGHLGSCLRTTGYSISNGVSARMVPSHGSQALPTTLTIDSCTLGARHKSSTSKECGVCPAAEQAEGAAGGTRVPSHASFGQQPCENSCICIRAVITFYQLAVPHRTSKMLGLLSLNPVSHD